MSRVEQTSGVVVDVGHGVATCCVVWEGEERPGPTSADPLTCSAPVVAQMVHSLVAQCSQDMRDVIRERIVVTGEPEFMCKHRHYPDAAGHCGMRVLTYRHHCCIPTPHYIVHCMLYQGTSSASRAQA